MGPGEQISPVEMLETLIRETEIRMLDGTMDPVTRHDAAVEYTAFCKARRELSRAGFPASCLLRAQQPHRESPR